MKRSCVTLTMQIKLKALDPCVNITSGNCPEGLGFDCKASAMKFFSLVSRILLRKFLRIKSLNAKFYWTPSRVGGFATNSPVRYSDTRTISIHIDTSLYIRRKLWSIHLLRSLGQMPSRFSLVYSHGIVSTRLV